MAMKGRYFASPNEAVEKVFAGLGYIPARGFCRRQTIISPVAHLSPRI
jgi:hypothetical protein